MSDSYNYPDGLINEWCEAHWQLLRAQVYAMFTLHDAWVCRDDKGRIIWITCGDKTFYDNNIYDNK